MTRFKFTLRPRQPCEQPGAREARRDRDLDRTYISQLENDKKSPTLDALFRIVDALGITCAELSPEWKQNRAKRGANTDDTTIAFRAAAEISAPS